MENAIDVQRIVKGKVYTVPTFTNSYGKIVNGSNATIKFYHPTNSSANHGVVPVTLVKVLLEMLSDKPISTIDEAEAVSHLEAAFIALNK